jgi:hypothetical protein
MATLGKITAAVGSSGIRRLAVAGVDALASTGEQCSECTGTVGHCHRD